MKAGYKLFLGWKDDGTTVKLWGEALHLDWLYFSIRLAEAWMKQLIELSCLSVQYVAAESQFVLG